MMMTKIAISLKCMASEAIYRKALKLTSTAKGDISTGQLVNIMSTDTSVLLQFVMIVNIIAMIPVMLVVCIVLVAWQMGKITWVAIGIYIFMLIWQFIFVGSANPVCMKVLTGIRVIKYYCWEKPFKGKVHDLRKVELKNTEKMAWIMSVGIDCMMSTIPNIVPLVCFSLYPSVMGKPLTSSVAFTSFTLFNMLQMPFAMMPFVMMLLVQFNVSVKRINNFMNLEEVDETLVKKNLPAGSKVTYKDIHGAEKVVEDYGTVLIRDGYFAWGGNDNCLKDITTRIPKGALVAVVGSVGSGKTSFVSSLVGEMTKNAGVVMVNGSMSLSAQQAWLVNDTVRGNILFGKPFEEAKYNEILKVCCLEDDLKVLAGGDMCEIGDRGINVSGGQKARISLARCCYSDSDIVVMDDPIAAVDSHVGKALFHKCIASYLKGKTRILVTNATQYLHKCDYIIVLENQTISHQGTYEELKAQNIDLMALLTEEDGSSSFSKVQRTASKREEEEKKEEKEVVNEEEEDKKVEQSVVNEEENEEDKKEKKADEAEEEKGPLILKGVNLTVEPHEKVGVVDRTGAGKSTMMIALFRITDLCEGSIAIDGIDLATLGLEDVRRALCIIPQDPVLFSASVRFNLDPFNEASDEDIWSVLEQVELKDAIERLPRGLDDDVQEGGSNFSHPKILIMDEATASLDNETDTHLQHMIRKQFATCTGLTIAHRLNTIMDAHRVCVMDKGVVAEYDTPANLLRKEGGIFRGMVIAANDPTLFDMVPDCEDMKELLKENMSSLGVC
ncbi:hypothetical protein WA577_006656 [Blastocystis sp. JDR]